MLTNAEQVKDGVTYSIAKSGIASIKTKEETTKNNAK